MFDKKCSGVTVPLFSVYSKNSVGIGDFGDIPLLVDWCRKTGNSILQLLPLNETGFANSPYDPLSGFALDPVYLALEKAPDLQIKFPTGAALVDYRVREAKLKKTHETYESNKTKCQKETVEFCQENVFWIEDYRRYKNHLKEDGDFWVWVQYLLATQLQKTHKYAQKHGVHLMGDFPIFVSKNSAEFWAHPDWFKKDVVSGAPPDQYATLGQRWGMPIYDWEVLSRDGYRLFTERLKVAQNYYDLLRLDHVIGYFRNYTISTNTPSEHQGLYGVLDPQEESQCRYQGRAILKHLKDSTEMQLCAEDLGTTPSYLHKILVDLGIPGAEVTRWNPKKPRALAVNSLSLSDLANFPLWWNQEANVEEKEKFWAACGLRGKFSDLCSGQLLTKALELNLSSQSIFAINLLVDWLYLTGELQENPMRMRVNQPGTTAKFNWSMVIPISLETLVKRPSNKIIKQLIQASGRANDRVPPCHL